MNSVEESNSFAYQSRLGGNEVAFMTVAAAVMTLTSEYDLKTSPEHINLRDYLVHT